MLYTYYGDDFTGSTDVLETLAGARIPAVLFLRPPTPEDLAQFPDAQAIGIAGDSRSRSPEWMTVNLPAIFNALKQLNAPITHYKTCSTFDSAPHIGNIGRAIELGIEAFHPAFVPIVVAAPHLGRYVIFGKLYAAAGDVVYRIDLHPTMSRHPVTPMREPDLRKHLALQTQLAIALLDIQHLTPSALVEAVTIHPAAILFDGLDNTTLTATGNLLWQHATIRVPRSSQSHRDERAAPEPNGPPAHAPLFAVGSSGLTQALITTWQSQNLITPSNLAPPTLTPHQNQVLVISGSCSPITQQQIEHAIAHGAFAPMPLNPTDLIQNPATAAEALAKTLKLLAEGRSPILYTALGPLDSATQPHSDELGAALGRLLYQILAQSKIRRTVLCGGDTSSHAIQQLPLTALTWLAPVAPGAPLCQAHSPQPEFHHAEFVLKGGQVGPPDFFEKAVYAE